jgi:regulator of cell morphogenesis and NO signaling
MIQPQQTVASVVTEHSGCARIFQQHRIDFCCRGDLSLQDAARERGVELAELLGQLEQAIAERRQRGPSAGHDLPTGELIEHIIEKHHAYLRKALPFLVPLAAKVGRVHGDHNPKLRTLSEAVKTLAEGLISHLDEEESRLFPAMRASGAAATPELTAALSAMQTEHLAVADLLSSIRDASDDFTLPDWACGSYRTLFGELQTMEEDIFRHVHLENHVLAPRFRSGDPPLSPSSPGLPSPGVASPPGTP